MVQEAGGEVQTDDVRSTFSQGDRVPPMPTGDVDHARCRRELEQFVQTTGLQPNFIGWSRKSPALRVAALEVVERPIGHNRHPTYQHIVIV